MRPTLILAGGSPAGGMLKIFTFLAVIFWIFVLVPNYEVEKMPLPDGLLSGEANFDILRHSLLIFLPPCVAVMAWAWRSRNAMPRTAKIVGGASALVLISSLLIFMGINILMDDSPASSFRMLVQDKYESYESMESGATLPAYFLVFESQSEAGKLDHLRVYEDEFNRTVTMQTLLTIRIRQGYFRHPYIENYLLQ